MKKLFKTIVLILILVSCQSSHKNDEGFIYTVNGKINIEKLNFALTHEHIMSNFGAEPSYQPNYDRNALFNQVVPYLKKTKALGVTSIFDCTTAYFGRDIGILKKLADSTGIQIITNTGFYGAANDRYIPDFAFKSDPEEISKRWISEFENGIDETGIKPGFIKLAFDSGAPSEIDISLFEAGILTHINTGLTMAVHTGNNPAAAKVQLELLDQYKVGPSAWVWVHAHMVEDEKLLVEAARLGAWISLDGVKESNIAEYIKKIDLFKNQKLLHKILLSHDGNSFPRGGNIREYQAIKTTLIPQLLMLNYTENEITQLMIKNPQEAFQIRTRTVD